MLWVLLCCGGDVGLLVKFLFIGFDCLVVYFCCFCLGVCCVGRFLIIYCSLWFLLLFLGYCLVSVWLAVDFVWVGCGFFG